MFYAKMFYAKIILRQMFLVQIFKPIFLVAIKNLFYDIFNAHLFNPTNWFMPKSLFCGRPEDLTKLKNRVLVVESCVKMKPKNSTELLKMASLLYGAFQREGYRHSSSRQNISVLIFRQVFGELPQDMAGCPVLSFQ